MGIEIESEGRGWRETEDDGVGISTRLLVQLGSPAILIFLLSLKEIEGECGCEDEGNGEDERWKSEVSWSGQREERKKRKNLSDKIFRDAIFQNEEKSGGFCLTR